MRAYDGRGASTTLLDAMVSHYDLEKPVDMVKVAYSEDFDKARAASFAKAVSRCAQEGDAVARDILVEAGGEVALGVTAVIRQLGMEGDRFVVGLIGGVFKSGEAFMSQFSSAILEVAPLATIQPAKVPAAVGALVYGFYALSELDSEIREAIEDSAQPLVEKLRHKPA